MQLEPNMDIYPGLDLVKNFGAHLGFRYFFTEGFGFGGWSSLAEYDKTVLILDTV
jgi:hypothetical protein